MKKVIRSTNDLLLAILMAGVSIFLLSSDKIITGVENGLGGVWAQASSSPCWPVSCWAFPSFS